MVQIQQISDQFKQMHFMNEKEIHLIVLLALYMLGYLMKFSFLIVINRQMYHYDLGPSLRQRFNPKQKKILRYNSSDRFSSFQSPPASDHELQEFSDYQSPPKYKVDVENKKQKSYILVQQLPLQYSSTNKKKNQNQSSKQNKLNQSTSHNKSISYSQKKENLQRKETSAIKYNYLEQVNRQLSTIKEDQRQYLRESLYTAHLQKNLHHALLIPTHFPPPPLVHPYYPSNNFFLDEQLQMQNRIVIEEQKLKTEELKLKNALLQQQNITLKQRIFFLQSQLRKKASINKQVQSVSPKINKVIQEQLQSNRRQTKKKLLEQIANLQSRCQQMKEEMTTYKLRQQERLNNLLKEQQTKKQIKHFQKKQQMEVQLTSEYYAKFVQVFLNMVEKLPFKLEPTWSKKKKIAVGWKIVKHFVRKGLKLGILPPTLIQRDDFQ